MSLWSHPPGLKRQDRAKHTLSDSKVIGSTRLTCPLTGSRLKDAPQIPGPEDTAPGSPSPACLHAQQNSPYPASVLAMKFSAPSSSHIRGTDWMAGWGRVLRAGASLASWERRAGRGLEGLYKAGLEPPAQQRTKPTERHQADLSITNSCSAGESTRRGGRGRLGRALMGPHALSGSRVTVARAGTLAFTCGGTRSQHEDPPRLPDPCL